VAILPVITSEEKLMQKVSRNYVKFYVRNTSFMVGSRSGVNPSENELKVNAQGVKRSVR